MLASNTAVKCSIVEIPTLHCTVTHGGDVHALLSPVFSFLDGDMGCLSFRTTAVSVIIIK
jgi:hypothetical protein